MHILVGIQTNINMLSYRQWGGLGTAGTVASGVLNLVTMPVQYLIFA